LPASSAPECVGPTASATRAWLHKRIPFCATCAQAAVAALPQGAEPFSSGLTLGRQHPRASPRRVRGHANPSFERPTPASARSVPRRSTETALSPLRNPQRWCCRRESATAGSSCDEGVQSGTLVCVVCARCRGGRPDARRRSERRRTGRRSWSRRRRRRLPAGESRGQPERVRQQSGQCPGRRDAAAWLYVRLRSGEGGRAISVRTTATRCRPSSTRSPGMTTAAPPASVCPRSSG
jgi:hypothetical protein